MNKVFELEGETGSTVWGYGVKYFRPIAVLAKFY